MECKVRTIGASGVALLNPKLMGGTFKFLLPEDNHITNWGWLPAMGEVEGTLVESGV